MKKNFIIIIIGGMLILGSCVQRTCPTYTKDVDKEKKEQQLKS